MALIDVRLRTNLESLLEALPLSQRLAALRGVEPELATLVEGFATLKVRRRYTVDSVAQAIRLIDDPDVLAEAIADEPRDSARWAMVRRRSELLSDKPSRRIRQRHGASPAERSLELLSVETTRPRFRSALSEVRNHPYDFESATLVKVYDRPDLDAATRSEVVIAAAAMFDHATLDRVLDDIDAGRTLAPPGRDNFDRFARSWASPLDARLCRWLASAEVSTHSQLDSARGMIERYSVTDEGRAVLVETGRCDLLLAAGAPVDEVLALALAGPGHHWPELLRMARFDELCVLADPILDATIEAGISPSMAQGNWNAAALHLIESFTAPDRRQSLRRALHLVAGRVVGRTLLEPSLGFTPDEMLEVVSDLLARGALASPVELVRWASDHPAPPNATEIIKLVFDHGEGLLEDPSWQVWAAGPYAEYLGERLGEDAVRWQLYFQLANSFAGTISSLLDALDASLAPTSR